ncbi:translocation/assembly module TamB domain-containing protein [uncultured Prevotella sp.]|uniref:translocation/assembly module TamB domain-containing protein n=1 Tax=uncultured Prevotella sp. TaxID=159272 RepID=UPI00263683CF|nr:translocation/assembly module TamB domain-containing protein [uncultured Prevotella sp.]
MKPVVKKSLIAVAAVVATPIIILILLAVLLYVPPVQNWAVRQVASYASESTGMTVRVDNVRLRFPLDLTVNGFLATQPNDSLRHKTDTIADARQLTASVRLRPLFHGNVVVDRLELADTKLNTARFIPSARVKGRVGLLSLRSRSINLNDETVHVDHAALQGARLDVALSDTVQEDTTSTPSHWNITLDRLDIADTKATVHMPGDSMRIAAGIGRLEAHNGSFNLFTGTYRVGSLDWREGTLNYDMRYTQSQPGLDYNHIALSGIAMHVDSLHYSDAGVRLRLKECALKEKSGLQINEFSTYLLLDSTHVWLPDMRLRTPRSMLTAKVKMDLSTFAESNPGVMDVNIKGYVVKTDFVPLLGFLPKEMLRTMPATPITVNADINGNMRRLSINQLSLTYPTAFALKASGKARNITSPDRLRADIKAEGRTYNLDFIKTLLPRSVAASFNIPYGIQLNANVHADGQRYAADFKVSEGGGHVGGKASVDMRSMAYNATLSAKSLHLSHFVPGLAAGPFTGSLKAHGVGTDMLSPHTSLDAEGSVDEFRYAGYDLSNMKLTANVHNGVGHALLDSHTPLLQGTINLNALMNGKRMDAQLACDLINADFMRMGISKRPLTASLRADVDLASDFKINHTARGVIGNIIVRDSLKTYTPERISLDIFTRRDSTHAAVTCGDFALRLNGSGTIEHILKQLQNVNDEAMRQSKERYIDQLRLRERLPDVTLYFDAGRENIFARTLRHFGYDFHNAYADMSASPSKGINGKLSLDSLVASGVQIDTIRLAFKSDSVKTDFEGQVRNNRSNKQFVFDARFRGVFHEQSLYFGTRIFDARERLGIALGLRAQMEHNGVRVSLGGIDPVLGYKQFKVNKNNYVFFANDKRLSADMALRADDGMAVRIYTNDSTEALQDVTIGLTRFDLQKVLAVVPYAPNISGILNGDFHYISQHEGDMSVSSSVSVDKMTYEGCPIGNLSSEFVYMPKGNMREHYVDGTLSMDDYEVCTLTGSYNTEGEGTLDADLNMSRTPLLLLNGFVPDRIIGFKGYAQGEVKVHGSLSRPDVNGEVYFDSAYVVSEPYGIEMRMCDDPLTVTDSRLSLENFQLFARNGNPLTLRGYVDFADVSNMSLSVRMRADNYLLIDSKETARSEAYGKAWVNFLGLAEGPLDALRVRGRLDVLGSTDITYILRDSPLSTDNQLDGLVKFVNFRDPDAVTVTRPPINGLNMDLTVNIDDGTHVMCALNADHSNYVDLIGGGDLRMLYTAGDGLSLYGRYTIGSGEMKYSLPVIPLKTFTIKDGSYAEFSGDPMNPRLNITATEENKTTVTSDGGAGRSVTFECGVVITKTLKDMGLQFTIDAPDDQQMHNELMTQSVENRGKLAVTMLTTGMYLADGNTNSFSMNNALSAFLNSQINAISGNALRTLDLSFGMDNTTLGSGQVHTDYSFKFSKRFWNNRLRIVIGGKVSSGAEIENQNETFFDNVTFEYRLSPNSNKYLKLFYDRDSYDWLEGYVEQFGGGFLWRKKMDSLKEIFRFRKPKQADLPELLNDTTRQKK